MELKYVILPLFVLLYDAKNLGESYRFKIGVYLWSRNPILGSRYFIDQEILPLLLSTGWLQERIRA